MAAPANWPEALVLARFLPERLHDGDSHQRLLNVRLKLAFNLPLVVGAGAQLLANGKRAESHERSGGD